MTRCIVRDAEFVIQAVDEVWGEPEVAEPIVAYPHNDAHGDDCLPGKKVHTMLKNRRRRSQ